MLILTLLVATVGSSLFCLTLVIKLIVYILLCVTKKKHEKNAPDVEWGPLYDVVLLISFNRGVIPMPREPRSHTLLPVFIIRTHCNYLTVWLSCIYNAGWHVTSCTRIEDRTAWSSISPDTSRASKCAIQRCSIVIIAEKNVRKCFFFSP